MRNAMRCVNDKLENMNFLNHFFVLLYGAHRFICIPDKVVTQLYMQINITLQHSRS